MINLTKAQTAQLGIVYGLIPTPEIAAQLQGVALFTTDDGSVWERTSPPANTIFVKIGGAQI